MKVWFSPELNNSALERSLKRLSQEKNLSIEFVESDSREVDLKILKLQFSDLHDELPAVIEPRAGNLRCYDTLVRQGSYLIPRLLFFEALNATIIQRAHDLDIRKVAYVVASDYRGLVCAAVCAQLGFQKIVLVDDDLQRSSQVIKILTRAFFGLSLKTIQTDAVTTQREPGSLMINSVDLNQNSLLLSDLSYFNFVAQGGVVVDISSEVETSPLLKDVEEAHLRSIHSLQFIQELILCYWQYLSPVHSLSREEIAQVLKNTTTV